MKKIFNFFVVLFVFFGLLNFSFSENNDFSWLNYVPSNYKGLLQQWNVWWIIVKDAWAYMIAEYLGLNWWIDTTHITSNKLDFIIKWSGGGLNCFLKSLQWDVICTRVGNNIEYINENGKDIQQINHDDLNKNRELANKYDRIHKLIDFIKINWFESNTIYLLNKNIFNEIYNSQNITNYSEFDKFKNSFYKKLWFKKLTAKINWNVIKLVWDWYSKDITIPTWYKFEQGYTWMDKNWKILLPFHNKLWSAYIDQNWKLYKSTNEYAYSPVVDFTSWTITLIKRSFKKNNEQQTNNKQNPSNKDLIMTDWLKYIKPEYRDYLENEWKIINGVPSSFDWWYVFKEKKIYFFDGIHSYSNWYMYHDILNNHWIFIYKDKKEDIHSFCTILWLSWDFLCIENEWKIYFNNKIIWKIDVKSDSYDRFDNMRIWYVSSKKWVVKISINGDDTYYIKSNWEIIKWENKTLNNFVDRYFFPPLPNIIRIWLRSDIFLLLNKDIYEKYKKHFINYLKNREKLKKRWIYSNFDIYTIFNNFIQDIWFKYYNVEQKWNKLTVYWSWYKKEFTIPSDYRIWDWNNYKTRVLVSPKWQYFILLENKSHMYYDIYEAYLSNNWKIYKNSINYFYQLVVDLTTKNIWIFKRKIVWWDNQKLDIFLWKLKNAKTFIWDILKNKLLAFLNFLIVLIYLIIFTYLSEKLNEKVWEVVDKKEELWEDKIIFYRIWKWIKNKFNFVLKFVAEQLIEILKIIWWKIKNNKVYIKIKNIIPNKVKLFFQKIYNYFKEKFLFLWNYDNGHKRNVILWILFWWWILSLNEESLWLNFDIFSLNFYIALFLIWIFYAFGQYVKDIYLYIVNKIDFKWKLKLHILKEWYVLNFLSVIVNRVLSLTPPVAVGSFIKLKTLDKSLQDKLESLKKIYSVIIMLFWTFIVLYWLTYFIDTTTMYWKIILWVSFWVFNTIFASLLPFKNFWWERIIKEKWDFFKFLFVKVKWISLWWILFASITFFILIYMLIDIPDYDFQKVRLALFQIWIKPVSILIVIWVIIVGLNYYLKRLNINKN